MRNVIAYYRVSTRAQGESGLGLDAQREAVSHWARCNNGEIIADFQEVESGSRSDRVELAKALALAKNASAVLVVAKLDRLARNVAFTSELMRSGVEFVACDNPHANKLTIHILAAVAEYELELISTRVKAALAQAKQRGVLLGSNNPKCRGKLSRETLVSMSQRGVAVRQQRAAELRALVVPVASELKAQGDSAAEIAKILNDRGYRTRRGLLWTRATVLKLLGVKA